MWKQKELTRISTRFFFPLLSQLNQFTFFTMYFPTPPSFTLLLHSSSCSSTMGEWRSVDPVCSQDQGCKFQCSPRAPDRSGAWALSAPTSSWPSGGLEGNEDWAAGARRNGDTARASVCVCLCVCVCVCTSFLGGISLQTQRKGFQGLLSSSPLVTRELITQQVTVTHTHMHTHTLTHTHCCLTHTLLDIHHWLLVSYATLHLYKNPTMKNNKERDKRELIRFLYKFFL